MSSSFFQDHPQLRPFVLSTARPTGVTLGSGSYGSVVEVAVPGALCAAKKIHDNCFVDQSQVRRVNVEEVASQFVRECQLMSTLRHPHIVQFLGVCFLPGSRLPALVTEKMSTSLHEILDPKPPPQTLPFIPVSLKCSILRDVSNGITFLHSQCPPMIHRDLSAKNVLLNEGMVAKIADIGINRFKVSIPTTRPTMETFLPPEALEDELRCDVTIDIFSIGVLALFVLLQTFPKPLAAFYMDESRKMVGRTELERREKYLQEIQLQFGEGHPLIKTIKQCLENLPKHRPNIKQVVQWLEQARSGDKDGEYDANKLSLVQQLQSKDQHIQQQRQQIHSQGRQINAQKRQNSALIEEIDSQKSQIESLDQQVQYLDAENAAFKNPHKGAVLADIKCENAPFSSVQWPLSLNWRKGRDIPTDKLRWASSVVLGGKVYCGGNDPSSSAVIEYTSECGEWSLPLRPPVSGFSMTSLNGQLVLAGGYYSDSRIRVYVPGSRDWVKSYPAMPSGRALSAVVGYQNYLIVACGFQHRKEVEVLDSSSGQWYCAQPVPIGGHCISSVVLGDHWYLSSFGEWEDRKEHIFCANLPTLISSSTSADTSTQDIWHELPTLPVAQPTLLVFNGHLLLVGGKEGGQEIYRYNKGRRQWSVCGLLPVRKYAPCCVLLTSGEVMIAGGWTGNQKKFSRKMYIANNT